MKAKVKFDSAQLKGFLLHHVEKLVFGGFVVAFLLICWSAFKLKPYGKTPDQLKATADRVSQDVEKAAPPDKFADLPSVPDFSNLGAVGPAAVDPRPYKIDPLSRPYEDRQELRKEPKLFALEELLAFAGYGGIAIDEKGGVKRMANNGIGSGMGMTPDMGMAGAMMPPGMGAGAMPPGMDPSEMMKGMNSGMQPPGMAPGMMSGMGPGAMMQGMKGRGRARGRDRKSTAKKKDLQKPAAPRPKPEVTEKIVLGQPPSGSKVEGRYWVCLVGAIPYRKEFLEYQNTFRDARGYKPDHDYPRYALPEIERAEVSGGKTGEWQSLDLVEAVQDFRKWAVEYPEIADKQFLDPGVTQPLPPLIFANHDKDKVNHPRTQLAVEKPAVVQEAPKKKKITNLTDATSGQADKYNRSPTMMGPMMRSAYMGGAAARLPEYRLFRFFDFAVEPGKTYRYRVKLAVVNPNADVQKRYLENYAFGEGDTREADWSQPSAPIAVIAGNRLLAGSVAPGRSDRSEPSGIVLAKLFDAQQAIEVRKVFDVHRGSVLNEQGMEIGLPLDPNVPTAPKESATVDFETNAVVLDLLGGEKLAGAKSSKVPGHFLVLDNDGAFKTLLQSSDAAMYETESEEAKKLAPPKEGDRKGAAPNADGTPNGLFDFNDEPTPKKRGRR
jgi:hypothetical protein